MRTLSACIFALIVAVELYFFLQSPTPMKNETSALGKWIAQNRVIDLDAKKDQNTKYSIIIGATILVGGIVTFSIPAGRRKANAIDSDLD